VAGSWVRQDRAVAERPGAGLGAALEPAGDPAGGQEAGGLSGRVRHLPVGELAFVERPADGGSREFRAEVGMLHLPAPRLAGLLVPGEQGAADRVAGVPAGGGDVDVAEGAVGEQPGVHHRVEGDPPAQAQTDVAPALDAGLPSEVERRLLDDGLEAEGDVLVELGDGFVGPAWGAEAL